MNEWLAEWWPIPLIVGVLAVLIVVCVHYDRIEEARWQAFKTAHHCYVVGRQDGYTAVGSGVGVDSKGGVVPVVTSQYIPARVTWRCDDGVDYTRDE